jgi:hypothetical protein
MVDDGKTTGPTGGIDKSRRPKLPSQSRRFLISDAMVLIAATAIGIALARITMPSEGWRRNYGSTQDPGEPRASYSGPRTWPGYPYS